MGSAREIQVVLAGARRIDAQVGEYLIRTDQPKDKGGGASAPSPFDLFLASLGTCAGIFVQGFCAQREIPFEQIRVIENVEFDDSGVLVRVDLKLELPAEFPEKYRDALLKVVEQCSVKRAIAAPEGSATVEKRPTFGISMGGTRIFPPSFSALAVDASTSSTTTYESQYDPEPSPCGCFMIPPTCWSPR